MAKIRRQLPPVAKKSLDHLESLVDGTHPGSHETKETRQDKAARLFAAGFMAQERAKQISETPRQLGVIVVHKRLEDTPANRQLWEADAARLGDSRAIEAVAVTKKEPV